MALTPEQERMIRELATESNLNSDAQRGVSSGTAFDDLLSGFTDLDRALYTTGVSSEDINPAGYTPLQAPEG